MFLFQVAMIFMTFLQSELKDVDPKDWHKKFLSYDNMFGLSLTTELIKLICVNFLRCNVYRLKLMKKPLPLPGPFKDVWSNIGRVTDPLHISNHKVSLKFSFHKTLCIM